jgi:hypothetical protein
MDAVPECQVALGGSPRQVHAIGVVELGMISIPGSEEQQDRGTGRDVDAAYLLVSYNAGDHRQSGTRVDDLQIPAHRVRLR